MHFSLTLSDGEVVDSFDHDLAVFTVGDGNFLPGFERKLWGLSPGMEKGDVSGITERFDEASNNIQISP